MGTDSCAFMPVMVGSIGPIRCQMISGVFRNIKQCSSCSSVWRVCPECIRQGELSFIDYDKIVSLIGKDGSISVKLREVSIRNGKSLCSFHLRKGLGVKREKPIVLPPSKGMFSISSDELDVEVFDELDGKGVASLKNCDSAPSPDFEKEEIVEEGELIYVSEKEAALRKLKGVVGSSGRNFIKVLEISLECVSKGFIRKKSFTNVIGQNDFFWNKIFFLENLCSEARSVLVGDDQLGITKSISLSVATHIARIGSNRAQVKIARIAITNGYSSIDQVDACLDEFRRGLRKSISTDPNSGERILFDEIPLHEFRITLGFKGAISTRKRAISNQKREVSVKGVSKKRRKSGRKKKNRLMDLHKALKDPDMHFLELLKIIENCMERGYDQKRLLSSTGKSRVWLSGLLGLGGLHTKARRMIMSAGEGGKSLGIRACSYIASLPRESLQIEAIEYCLKNECLRAYQVEVRVDIIKKRIV